ncbi:unnamed protein product [Lupinus luteus]|uniref:Uncharacterized protein n=1 Tax=Lupinus luteus TaxID=3873 RepID=A0AAV1YFP7_LUPLU
MASSEPNKSHSIHHASIFGSRFLSDALPEFCIPARIQDETRPYLDPVMIGPCRVNGFQRRRRRVLGEAPAAAVDVREEDAYPRGKQDAGRTREMDKAGKVNWNIGTNIPKPPWTKPREITTHA